MVVLHLNEKECGKIRVLKQSSVLSRVDLVGSRYRLHSSIGGGRQMCLQLKDESRETGAGAEESCAMV